MDPKTQIEICGFTTLRKFLHFSHLPGSAINKISINHEVKMNRQKWGKVISYAQVRTLKNLRKKPDPEIPEKSGSKVPCIFE